MKNSGKFCVSGDKKSDLCAPRKAANLFQHEAGEDNADLYRGIAALRLANDQLFVSVEMPGLPDVREPPLKPSVILSAQYFLPRLPHPEPRVLLFTLGAAVRGACVCGQDQQHVTVS